MKKDKADINKMASSGETTEATGSKINVDEINGWTMLFLLHLIFSKWAVDSISSYKENNAGSEPTIINFSYADDKNLSADEITYYNTIALLQEKYCKDNGHDDGDELNNPFVFLSKECSDYLLNKRNSSEKQVTLELEGLADGVIYYPYLPRISEPSNSETIFSKKTSYGRYTAEILTALTGIFYTTQNNEYKGKIIECDAALTVLLADYLKPSTELNEFLVFLKNTNSYTKSEKATIKKIIGNLRLKNFKTNLPLLSFYYSNPESIIDQLIFIIRRAWSKDISMQIDNNKDKKITMSLFTCLEKVDELLNMLTLISSRKNSTKDLTEETKQLENDEYLIFTRDTPDMGIKYNQITGITIATYKISKYLNDLIRSGDFPSVNLHDWQCGYHKYWLPKIISQFMLIIYVEKKQFLNMSQYNILKRKELDDSVPEVFFKYINDEEEKDEEVSQFRHPFIAKGNSNAEHHQKNCESRAKFDNVMDDVLDKYNPIFYEAASHIATEECSIDQAVDIAKNVIKTPIFDMKKYREFYKNYFLKFDNIFNALSSIDKRDTLYPEAQKIKIREALDSQDKSRGRKALWDLIDFYGHYINNKCRSCRYYDTYTNELDDSKSKTTSKNTTNIRREWEYNPDGCNHRCSTGKILSEIESALYDLYSMFDLPDDNDTLR